MRHLFILALFISSCHSEPQPTPEPTQNVGTTYYQWVDSSRVDDYYGGQRIVNVQVWYPADLSDTIKEYPIAPYYYKLDQAYDAISWSRSDLEESKQIITSARLGAPIANQSEGYPLLLLSPSLGGNTSHYTYYAERLAAAGFIVAGVNHLYESLYVIGPEEYVFSVNLTFHDSLKTLDIPKEITADEYRSVKGIRQKVLGEDLLFALDQLTRINESDFADLIDTIQVGSWGHSMGGAASVYAAYLDPRIKAVANLDGTPPSVALAQGIDQAFLFVEDLKDYKNHQGYSKVHERRTNFCERIKATSYRILIADTQHNSFMDFNYRFAASEEERGEELRVIEQTYSYLATFFTHHLSGVNTPIFTESTTDSLEVFVFP